MVAGSSIAATSRMGPAQRGQTRVSRPKVRFSNTLHASLRSRPGLSGPTRGADTGLPGRRQAAAATDGDWAAAGAGAGAPGARSVTTEHLQAALQEIA